MGSILGATRRSDRFRGRSFRIDRRLEKFWGRLPQSQVPARTASVCCIAIEPIAADCEDMRRDDRIGEAISRNVRVRTFKKCSGAKNRALQQGVNNRFGTVNFCVTCLRPYRRPIRLARAPPTAVPSPPRNSSDVRSVTLREADLPSASSSDLGIFHA